MSTLTDYRADLHRLIDLIDDMTVIRRVWKILMRHHLKFGH